MEQKVKADFRINDVESGISTHRASKAVGQQWFNRRGILAGAGSLLASHAMGQTAQGEFQELQPRTYDDGLIPRFSFELIELSLNGELGVFARDTETGRESAWGADKRMPLNSTFKFLLAAAVLLRSDLGQESLGREVIIQQTDIVTWSPVLDKLVGRVATVQDLCMAMMSQSDNAAANLLLKSVGGPAALTAILREVGDSVTRIDRFEPDLNDVPPGDVRDTTTPKQMVENLDAFLLKDILSEQGKSALLHWLGANAHGGLRIRAGVPSGWRVGDRTGLGRRGETATVAVIFPPARKPLLMAVYIRGSDLRSQQQNQSHAELARIATTNVLLPPFDPYPDD